MNEATVDSCGRHWWGLAFTAIEAEGAGAVKPNLRQCSFVNNCLQNVFFV